MVINPALLFLFKTENHTEQFQAIYHLFRYRWIRGAFAVCSKSCHPYFAEIILTTLRR
jgi:hypothetical protein